MELKKRPNHSVYIRILQRMTAEERLLKAFELSDFSRELFISGLRKRFPGLNETDLKARMLERLQKCHNRNY
jgi:hypothetical protein